MSFLQKIRGLFSRKKNYAQQNAPEQAVHMQQPTPVHVPEKQEERLEPKPEEIHKERKCPFCDAPNDTFVSVCWLCKKKI